MNGSAVKFAMCAALAFVIPLIYVFHSSITETGQEPPTTQYLKGPKGPARWNPFQSKTATKQFEMMLGFDDSDLPPITIIERDELEEILDVLAKDGREKSKYVVIDVRSEEEIAKTGAIHEVVYNIPMHCVTMRRAFAMGDEEFRDAFGFEKPTKDETVVFSCKTGKSSQMAAEMAALEGYQNLLNYIGGSTEWFA